MAQIVAKNLNIPMDQIQFHPTNTITGNNTESSGGSVTTELLGRVGFHQIPKYKLLIMVLYGTQYIISEGL